MPRPSAQLPAAPHPSPSRRDAASFNPAVTAQRLYDVLFNLSIRCSAWLPRNVRPKMKTATAISLVLSMTFSAITRAQDSRGSELGDTEPIVVDVPYTEPDVPGYWTPTERSDYARGYKAAWQFGIREKHKAYLDRRTHEIVRTGIGIVLCPEKGSPALLLGYHDGAEKAERDFGRFVQNMEMRMRANLRPAGAPAEAPPSDPSQAAAVPPR